MLLTVHDIKTMKEIPSCPSTRLTVLSVSELETTNDRKRFYAVLADSTGAISATVNNEKDHGKFIQGFGVTLMNVLCKKSYIGVTIKTEVAMCQAIAVTEEMTGSLVNTIEDALGSQDKTVLTVKGKVTKTVTQGPRLLNKGAIDIEQFNTPQQYSSYLIVVHRK
ncbi:Hypothetical predicted protein [Mytilus galloprovincialis]|uniref:Uncharacterized protein n=1 Tax=Mytilus galloprovincialis TaxID=29158 RepID=A0A8B6GLF2_MYTGA|nr:Hypothetical predicted protein [Mytilus galloprovincialis]